MHSAGKKNGQVEVHTTALYIFLFFCILCYYTTPTSKSSCASTHLIHPTFPLSGKKKKNPRELIWSLHTKKIWLVYSKTAWSSLKTSCVTIRVDNGYGVK